MTRRRAATVLGIALLVAAVYNAKQDADAGEDQFLDLLLESYGFWGALAVLGIAYS